jgi:hypothetical protein
MPSSISSNTNCQELKIGVEQGKVLTTLIIIKH